MVVFAHNSPFGDKPYYKKSIFRQLAVPSCDTHVFIPEATNALERIFKEDIEFHKSGIGLLDLQDNATYQPDLFNESSDKPELMQCLDSINARYGRNTLYSAGVGKTQKFKMRREFLSPQYTTCWAHLPRISC